MVEKQRTLRIMAARLREKLQRSVPKDILDRMTDAELVQEWHYFEKQKCNAAKMAERCENKELRNIVKNCLTNAA